MKKEDVTSTSAYQGKGWRPRLRPHSEEAGSAWADLRTNSEFAPLKAVLLYKPARREILNIRRPKAVQHLRPIAFAPLDREFRALKNTYRKLGVKVFEIEPGQMGEGLRLAPPNLMFVCDLFFNSPEGAVIARMASEVRAGEEKFAAAALARLGVPILSTMRDRALFEGADCLWLNPKTILCGTGQRTNHEALLQIRSLFKAQGIKVLEVKMPKGIQHLLGMVQFVDSDLAVVRTEIAPRAFVTLLKKNGFEIVPVRESIEVREKLGMNLVTVSPRKVIMAADCPQLRTQFEAAGIQVAAEVKISQLCNAAGGIGCATGVLARELLP